VPRSGRLTSSPKDLNVQEACDCASAAETHIKTRADTERNRQTKTKKTKGN
jgi:hypothetical protein